VDFPLLELSPQDIFEKNKEETKEEEVYTEVDEEVEVEVTDEEDVRPELI